VIREKTDNDRPLIGAQRRGQRVCHAVDSSSGQLVPGHFAGVKTPQVLTVPVAQHD
jgi:hypothetical protein